MLVSWNFQKNLNILFTVHIVKFIRASLWSIKQKLQTSTVAAETVNNFTDELLRLVAIDELAMNAYHAQCWESLIKVLTLRSVLKDRSMLHVVAGKVSTIRIASLTAGKKSQCFNKSTWQRLQPVIVNASSRTSSSSRIPNCRYETVRC